MKLLKQTTSGSIYVWTKILAQRDDMEDYIVVPPEPVQSLEKPVEVNQELTTEEESTPEPSDEDIKTLAKAVLIKKPGRKPSGK